MASAEADKTSVTELEGEALQRYMRALLADVRALERMLAEGMFEQGVSRIGAEQEMFLVDRAFNASPSALKVLEQLDDPHFTTELGLFNLEMNTDPQPLEGEGLSRMEAQIGALYGLVERAAAALEVQPVITGILPTLARTDLALDNIVPNPRYLTLNRVMTAARGEGYDISIKGLDELVAKLDSVMFEACNASFQVHLQVDEPARFGHVYDVAQLVIAPALAVSANSPTLFGKRLWAETRIALFEQSCDVRTRALHARDDSARVSFGKRWIEDGAAEIFKENITRFRPLVGIVENEDAIATLDAGKIPLLRALRLHSGTVYRWNRPCYGISENGRPHLRIELRALPSGPSVVDEVANAAFWLGLMKELSATVENLSGRLEFDQAQANFYAAAREGLAARFTWLDGEDVIAQPFILDRLLPIAEAGLARARVADADAKRYLEVIDKRVRTLRTGAQWALRSLAGMHARGPGGERLAALVAATIARQGTGRPVAEWERARLDEIPTRRTGYAKVFQYMQTDLVTVRPEDPIELAGEIMSWERLRHLPVEEEGGKLVGVITMRGVLRCLTSRGKLGVPPEKASVADVMRRDPVTVTPDTSTLEAIGLMRRHRIGCLPVVQEGRIVAMVMEEDFMGIAADLLEERFGTADLPHTHPRRRKR